MLSEVSSVPDGLSSRLLVITTTFSDRPSHLERDSNEKTGLSSRAQAKPELLSIAQLGKSDVDETRLSNRPSGTEDHKYL